MTGTRRVVNAPVELQGFLDLRSLAVVDSTDAVVLMDVCE